VRFGAHRAALLFYYCLFCPAPRGQNPTTAPIGSRSAALFRPTRPLRAPTPSTNTLMPHTLIVSGHTDLNNSAANLRILHCLERDLANVEVLRLDALYTEHTGRQPGTTLEETITQAIACAKALQMQDN